MNYLRKCRRRYIPSTNIRAYTVEIYIEVGEIATVYVRTRVRVHALSKLVYNALLSPLSARPEALTLNTHKHTPRRSFHSRSSSFISSSLRSRRLKRQEEEKVRKFFNDKTHKFVPAALTFF